MPTKANAITMTIIVPRYGWWGAPFFPYGGGCGWLYRNAKATGSAYWWNRYYECIRVLLSLKCSYSSRRFSDQFHRYS